MKKVALTFGLIGSGLILVYFLIVFLLLGDPTKMTSDTLQVAEVFGYLRYLILLLTLIFAMRSYRQQPGVAATYWGVVRAGVIVSLIVGFVVGLMEMIYVAITPEFFDGYYNATMQSMQLRGASATEIASFKEMFESFSWLRNPALTGLFYFAQIVVLGGILSLIIGIFMRPKTTPQLASV